jgi:L-fucose isomerase
MCQPKVGLITFGDARVHEWENYFRYHTEPRHRQAIDYFRNIPVKLFWSKDVARQKQDIDNQVDALKAAGAESFIAHVPCWTSPNLVVRGVERMNLPTVLMGNKHPSTHGTVGFLGAGGALDQIGKTHLRIREDYDGPNAKAIEDKAMPLIRAASVAARLPGKVFGIFGGRSLGIDTGTLDPMQWRRMFGVDVEHIDQLEIIRRSEHVPEDKTDQMLKWLEDNFGAIAYDEKALTPEKLAFQVRCYLATKEIIREMGLDFVAIKCMPDLTTHYIPQCLTAALLPGPFDADGSKEPTVMACEADADAGLTLEILKEVSGGKPTLFGDVSYINEAIQTFYLPNCGALCAWYAGRAEMAAENLKHVEIRPAMRPAGGGIAYFTCAAGPLTLARLYRKAGEYKMAILTGEAIRLSKKDYEDFVKARGRHQLPTAFVKVTVDIDAFINEFGSNHICGVAGSYVHELEQVCRMLDVTPVIMDQ